MPARTCLSSDGAREGAPHMAEKFRFQQRVGDGRTVDLDEGHVPLRAAAVYRARDQLFAGAGFARDQHGAAGRGYQVDPSDHLGHGAAMAHDAIAVEMWSASTHCRREVVRCSKGRFLFAKHDFNKPSMC